MNKIKQSKNHRWAGQQNSSMTWREESTKAEVLTDHNPSAVVQPAQKSTNTVNRSRKARMYSVESKSGPWEKVGDDVLKQWQIIFEKLWHLDRQTIFSRSSVHESKKT